MVGIFFSSSDHSLYVFQFCICMKIIRNLDGWMFAEYIAENNDKSTEKEIVSNGFVQDCGLWISEKCKRWRNILFCIWCFDTKIYIQWYVVMMNFAGSFHSFSLSLSLYLSNSLCLSCHVVIFDCGQLTILSGARVDFYARFEVLSNNFNQLINRLSIQNTSTFVAWMCGQREMCTKRKRNIMALVCVYVCDWHQKFSILNKICLLIFKCENESHLYWTQLIFRLQTFCGLCLELQVLLNIFFFFINQYMKIWSEVK